jgi:hypothetical protein
MNLNTGGWASRVLTPLLRIIRSSPNATVPVVVISEPVNSETAALVNADIALVAKGTGATLAQVPDGTTANGAKRGAGAVDWQKKRNAGSRVASGDYATISGGSYNGASGSNSTVAGGENSIASSSYSSIGGGQNNTASSNYSFVGGGQNNGAKSNSHATCVGGSNNNATGNYSFVGGGQTNTASSLRSVVAGGVSNVASGSASTVCGGAENLANASYSFISGGYRGTARSIQGYHVFPAIYDAISGGTLYGKTQSALLLLARETTDATATVLTSNASAASTTNQVILPNNAAYSFSGEVIAGVTAAGDTARWTIDGAIKRGANAASTAMVGTPTVTMTHNDAGAAAWAVAVTADTTNGGIKVEVTGAAATTIRWVCKINTTEMTY